MVKKQNFVIRTIRNGQVKINGRIFRPDNLWMEYDGRLDGVRYAWATWNTTAYQQVVDERRRRIEEAIKPKEKQLGAPDWRGADQQAER
jgi:hypothetical protein